MIPHIQTNTSKVDGNCWQTCLASVLDLEAEQVPHFVGWEVHHDLDYWRESFLWRWYRGYEMYYHDRHRYHGEYYMAVGKTVRDTTHVCVYRNGQLAHDPHPSGVGLTEVEAFVSIRQR